MHEELLRLRSIGLTEGELKVYGALLKIGSATKTALAKNAGVAPANLYDITNRLAEKGIISIVEQNGVKHFSPADPSSLLGFLDQKKEEIKQEETVVKNILPMLQAMRQSNKNQTQVEMFTGWRGLTTVFEDLLLECRKGDHCFVSGATIGEQRQQADRFFLKYSKQRAEKGILLSIIFNEDIRKRKDRLQFFLKSSRCDVRFLNQNSMSEMMLYKETTIILVMTAEPIAIRIRDRTVTEAFLQQFNTLWNVASK